MALLDLPSPYPAHVEQREPYGSRFPSGTPSGGSGSSSSDSISSGGGITPALATVTAGRDSLCSSSGGSGGGGGLRVVRAGDIMQTSSSLKASASSGSLAPPPGLPRSSSTAELVALGFDPSGGVEGNDLGNDSGGGGGYDSHSSLSNSGGGGGMGSSNGGVMDGGGEMGRVGGIGTGSAGGMGLAFRNHSLTNLANMVRSQSVSSFHSDIFGNGRAAARPTVVESPAWGSYPANLDKMAGGGGGGGGGGDAFTTSPLIGPRGPSRSTAVGMRSVGGGGGGGDGGGVDLSPPQFAGRGTAARREVAERGLSASSVAPARASQRRPMGGGVPSSHGGRAPTSGRAMVHNRSDTDLVASFSRMGFGQGGGVSRWSPHMSPTESPLGAPLLEEDPLDLDLEKNALDAGGGGMADTFGAPSSFLKSHGRRGLVDGGGGVGGGGDAGIEVRLPRHASYPSLAGSRGGDGGGVSYGMEDLVHGALEHLTAGDSATGGGGGDGEGSGVGLAPAGMSSGSLSGSVSGRGGSSGDRTTGQSPAGAGGGTSSGVRGSSGGGSGGSGGYNSSPGHSPVSAAQRQQSQGMARQPPPRQHRGGQDHRPSHHQHHQHHQHHPQAYDHQGRGDVVDGTMMRDGRFVPSAGMRGDGGYPGGMMYGEGGGFGGGMGGGGYDSMMGGSGGGMMDMSWGGQDPLAMYQALLMKQSLAAAASGMRFPNMHGMNNMNMPAANGMGMNMNMNMVDVASLAAAAQAASGGRGGYSGYPGLDPHMQQSGGYGRRDQRMGPRGDMGGGDYGMAVGPVGGGGRMGPGMARGGGMYDMAESDLGDGNVYHVQFKRSTRNFLLGKTCQRDLQVGDYVKVEADRGEDLGHIVNIFPIPEAGRPLPATAGQKRGFGQFEREHIIRAATEDEVQMVKDKMRDEDRVLEVCRAKVLQRSLPMRVMDAEFQYDRHKLTFFFEAEGRIDFRELVRDLFSLYKTRIWMQQLEPETTPSGGPMQTPYSPQEMHGMPDHGHGMVGGDMGGMNMGGPML